MLQNLPEAILLKSVSESFQTAQIGVPKSMKEHGMVCRLSLALETNLCGCKCLHKMPLLTVSIAYFQHLQIFRGVYLDRLENFSQRHLNI